MRLLITEVAFQRVGAAIGAEATLLIMDRAGEVTLGGKPVAPEAIQPEAAWISPDVFGGQMRSFMIALLKASALQWVQSSAAGFDDPVFARLMAKGARLTTSSAQAPAIAEYVLAGVLDHFQGGPARRLAQSEHRWAPQPFREVAGSVWLLVGFGAIGQALARRVRAFEGQVVGVRRQARGDEPADRMLGPKDVLSALPEADVAVLCLPLTPQTTDLADGGFFSAMKPASVFVNVGRGGLVDEPALLRGLDRGTPGHAILDVFQTEPLPGDSGFWSHPNVSVTAHTAARGDGRDARGDALFLENLRRVLTDEPLVHEADPADAAA